MSLVERISVAAGATLVVVAALACKGGGAGGGGTTSASVAVSAATAPTSTATLTPVTDQAIVVRLMKELSKAAGCPSTTGANRMWCLADTFDKGERDGSLDDAATYLGFTIGLSDDFPATQSLQKNVELSALAIDKRNGDRFAWISSVKPTGAGDQAAIASARTELADLLRDDGYKAELAASLYDYVRSLSDQAKYTVTPMKDAWRIGGPATTDVRKVGKVLVAVEVPPAVPLKAIYVSIFTDKYGKKR